MESCKFPSTYTVISGLLDDENNSKYKILCHSCSKQAKCCPTGSQECQPSSVAPTEILINFFMFYANFAIIL